MQWTSVIWKLLQFVWLHRKMLLVALSCAFLTMGSSIGLLFTSGLLIAKAALHPSIAELSVAIVGVRFFGLSRGVLRYVERLASHWVALNLLTSVRTWFYRVLEPLTPLMTRDLRKGEILNHIHRDVSQLEFLYARVLAPGLNTLLVSLLVVVALSVWSSFLALVYLLGVMAAALGPLLSMIPLMKLRERVRSSSSSLEAVSLEIRQGWQELKQLGALPQWEQELLHYDKQWRQAERSIHRWVQAGESWVLLWTLLTVVGVLWTGSFLFHQQVITGVQWTAFVLGTWASFESLQGLPVMADSMSTTFQSARKLFEFDLRNQQQQKDEREYLQEPATILSTNSPKNSSYLLDVKNVSLYWPDGHQQISDFDLTLAPEEWISLQGPSGSGKSLFVYALAGAIPYQGSICLDSKELKQIPLEKRMQDIAILDQFPHLFTGSIRDNLTLGLDLEKNSDWEEQALQAMDFLGLRQWAVERSLDQNPLNAWIGEHGRALSGGQRQRIAAIRAWLRPARLVILDEPAAHLEAELQLKIVQLFAQKKTQACSPGVLVISHQSLIQEQCSRMISIG